MAKNIKCQGQIYGGVHVESRNENSDFEEAVEVSVGSGSEFSI